ncbi:MAG: CPBP family intramembrane metalloprotease [Deltaproteobacteria bacterium]|nr:CPBP family intramembrane metalloprotease [Deltaproteobacteria bacterium]
MQPAGQIEGAPAEAQPPRVRWRRVAFYYLLVYAVSYGLVGAFLASGGSFEDSSWVFFAQASSLVPALSAIALGRWLWRMPLRDSLALRLRFDRWLLVALLVPWLLCLLALGFGLLVPGVRWDGSLQPAVEARILSPEQLDLLARTAEQAGLPTVLLLVPMGLLSSVSMSFLAGCGEEIGWRGFVHGALRPLGFFRNALVTGLLWAGWHLPLLALGYGFPQHPGLGAALLSAHCLLVSVGHAYLRERAGSSLAVGLFHGTTEAAMLLAVAPLAGGSEITVGMGSLTWLAAELVIVCGFLAHDRFVSKEPITR